MLKQLLSEIGGLAMKKEEKKVRKGILKYRACQRVHGLDHPEPPHLNHAFTQTQGNFRPLWAPRWTKRGKP